jgi:hypothetical protein
VAIDVMTVSVIVPLYNKQRHVLRAITSVLAQTVPDFEVVVVDDGSTDGGGDIVRRMTDSRIRLVSQENAGVSAARNRGIAESRSELVAFLDADDEWEPGFLETVLALREQHPGAGIYATAYRYQKGETTWRPHFVDCVDSGRGGLLDDYFRAAMGQAPVWTSAVMIPKWVFSEVGAFPVGVKTGEDRHMWARIALRHPIAWSPIEGAVYHLSADNRACALNPPAQDLAEAEVIEEFLRSGSEPLSSRAAAQEYLIARRLALALECHLDGETAWAMSLIDKTRGTSEYRWRRLWLRAAFHVPPRVLIRARAAKAQMPLPRRGPNISENSGST